MKVIVTGANGMVGRAVVELFNARGSRALPLDHSSLDISDRDKVTKVFQEQRPEAVINCAAWTDVDGCESDPERSNRVNALGPEILAEGCRRVGASFLTISTDYVFDGEMDGFYTQRNDPNPQGVYAVSKLLGERRAQAASARTIVIRTGWIFGRGGKNFLSKILEISDSGKPIMAIDDYFGTPTYVVDLSARIYDLINIDLPGIYHIVNSGNGASYKEFALEVLRAAGREGDVKAVSGDTLKRPAPRPRNSRLKCILSEHIGLEPLLDWRQAVKNYVSEATV
jgi:dTDP-4-dehydrorhamnose reductase